MQSLAQQFKSKTMTLIGITEQIARANQARAENLFSIEMMRSDDLRRARFVQELNGAAAERLSCPVGAIVVEFRDKSKLYLPAVFTERFARLIRKAIDARTPPVAHGRKLVKRGSTFAFEGLRP